MINKWVLAGRNNFVVANVLQEYNTENHVFCKCNFIADKKRVKDQSPKMKNSLRVNIQTDTL